jgi:hypothetical protein
VVGGVLTLVVLAALILLLRSRKQGSTPFQTVRFVMLYFAFMLKFALSDLLRQPTRLDHELRQLLQGGDDDVMIEGDKYLENRDGDDRSVVCMYVAFSWTMACSLWASVSDFRWLHATSILEWSHSCVSSAIDSIVHTL